MPAPADGRNSGNVKVVVRVRAFLPRETERGAGCLVQMNPQSEETRLLIPDASDPANARLNTRKVLDEKSFTFDKSFWSHDRLDAHYAHQEEIYNSLGEEYLDHNFEGYHTCIFAYGQTGSGKSYTMMGTPEEPGLIPRTCQDLFERIESNEDPSVSYNVRVSYFEVYNEHVRDLLVPRTNSPYYLKIRESPTEGPYIKDLTDQPVRNYNDIVRLMKAGDSSRTTASTKMNDTSSRSHAVFTIMLKQIHADMTTDETTERTARIRLVDLAGSERAKATEATGARLREGSNINKSLTTLGRVIAALADAASSRAGSPKKRAPPRAAREIVPYRDSILTWLLKDSLGGNSKTAMIACIAPSDYDETLSTLRYADQAKRIRTRAVVNQDCMSSAERDAQIMTMQETINNLQVSLTQRDQSEAQWAAASTHAATMKKEHEAQTQQLEEYQKQVQKMQRLMEDSKQIGEGKIQALRTENEALRLHLKLAVESLKNPVGAPKAVSANTSRPRSRAPSEKIAKESLRTIQGARHVSPDVQEWVEQTTDQEWDHDSETDVDWGEAEALEVQAQMKDLLNDVGMFKRKLGDDRSRFLDAPVPSGGHVTLAY
ncbi:MAG: Kinesin [Chrysothrix sp. TS-e1954]|nr:MAG: Kinesin [Chrysothrix sp. TS-e1954]